MAVENDNLPKLDCDLVMRGGITSGLVYPQAVAELSKHYRFRSIGGTSAGAIAASVTAAAEYGRYMIIARGQHDQAYIPFKSLAHIPDELGGVYNRKTKLLRLFKPAKKVRPLFQLALAMLGRAGPRPDDDEEESGEDAEKPMRDLFGGVGARALAMIKATVRAFPISSALGALPGFILGLSITAGTTRRYWEQAPSGGPPGAAESSLGLLGLSKTGPTAGSAITFENAVTWLSVSAMSSFSMIALCVLAFWLFKRVNTVLGGLALGLGISIALHYYLFYAIDLLGLHVDLLSQTGSILGLLIATFAALVGAVLTSSLMMLRMGYKWLPQHMYGICSGLSEEDKYNIPGVTNWLHQRIQAVAGRTAQEKPLTAGDLWLPLHADQAHGDIPRDEREIELSLMVTNITRGISHRFPFMEGWRGALYFKKSDMEQLFPKEIVDYMVAHAQEADEDVTIDEGVYRLPPPEHLPLVFGARMSMSFPFLLAAVPLYAVDWSFLGEDKKYRLKCCWFSDGGLTSNFPIGFFDTPLPWRPSFGINLVPDTARHVEVALPEVSEGGTTRMNVDAWDFTQRPRERMHSPAMKKAGGAKKGAKNAGPKIFQRNRSKDLIEEDIPEGLAPQMGPPESPGAAPARGPANGPARAGGPDEDAALWDDIWMPRRNDQDMFKVIRFNDFGGEKGSVGGFFGALFDTARNWADTELTYMPGYRDRIVHVELKPDEGGLNLDMPDHVIKSVGAKGRLAGRLLAARFAPNPESDPQWGEEIELTWENHRWVRFRTTMAALEHLARDVIRHIKYEGPSNEGVRSYEEMLESSHVQASHYRWASKEQYEHACQVTKDLADFVGRWRMTHETLDAVEGYEAMADGRAPRPKSGFRIFPPGDADPHHEKNPEI